MPEAAWPAGRAELGPRLATERARTVTLRLPPATASAQPGCGGPGGRAGDQGDAWTAAREPDPVPGTRARWAAQGPSSGLAVARFTRGKNRMREFLTYGSVRGAVGNRRPYRDHPHCDPSRSPPDDRTSRSQIRDWVRNPLGSVPSSIRLSGVSCESGVLPYSRQYARPRVLGPWSHPMFHRRS